MTTGQLCQLRLVLKEIVTGNQVIVNYMFIIVKYWCINCEMIVEYDNCQLRVDESQVRIDLVSPPSWTTRIKEIFLVEIYK